MNNSYVSNLVIHDPVVCSLENCTRRLCMLVVFYGKTSNQDFFLHQKKHRKYLDSLNKKLL